MLKICPPVLGLCLMLACCGKGKGETPVTTRPEPTASVQTTPREDTPNPEETGILEITLGEAVVYEGSGVKITVKGMESGFMGWEIRLLVIAISGDDVVVNWESGLEENGIEEIEEITFTIHLTDPNSYETLGKSGELRVVIGE